MTASDGKHRIGQFARRVGVSPELLRAWEQRYALLQPDRSAGGFRLYGDADAERVARMLAGLERGLSAAEAARVALAGDPPAAGDLVTGARLRILRGIERYDEAEVQAALDDALAAFGLETFVRDLILPTLTEVGRRWEAGEGDITQEHFASNLIRGRLLALARLWGRGPGPLALLACAAGEQHDISLLAFGLLLRSHGWRVLFLGADIPVATVAQAARTLEPAAVVLVSFDSALLLGGRQALRSLADAAPLFLAGPGATAELARRLRLQRLDGDLVSAAGELAQRRAG